VEHNHSRFISILLCCILASTIFPLRLDRSPPNSTDILRNKLCGKWGSSISDHSEVALSPSQASTETTNQTTPEQTPLQCSCNLPTGAFSPATSKRSTAFSKSVQYGKTASSSSNPGKPAGLCCGLGRTQTFFFFSIKKIKDTKDGKSRKPTQITARLLSGDESLVSIPLPLPDWLISLSLHMADLRKYHGLHFHNTTLLSLWRCLTQETFPTTSYITETLIRAPRNPPFRIRTGTSVTKKRNRSPISPPIQDTVDPGCCPHFCSGRLV
jgi:hypothetical protein